MTTCRVVSKNWDDSTELLGIERCLPKRLCSTCQILAPYVAAADIPETLTFDLLNILSPYQQEMPDDLLVAMDEAADAENWENPVWTDIESFGAISSEEFTGLVQRIRDSLQLDQRRIVQPGARIGPLRVRMQQPLAQDIIGGEAEVVLLLSSKAAELLNQSGLSGFQIFPVDSGTPALYSIYELIVLGNAGLPKTQPEGYWKRCEECGEWWLQKDQPYSFEIDRRDWDGSDFFHFAGKGYIYVTKRAKCWLESSGLRLGIGFVDLKSDAYGYRAFLGKNV